MSEIFQAGIKGTLQSDKGSHYMTVCHLSSVLQWHAWISHIFCSLSGQGFKDFIFSSCEDFHCCICVYMCACVQVQGCEVLSVEVKEMLSSILKSQISGMWTKKPYHQPQTAGKLKPLYNVPNSGELEKHYINTSSLQKWMEKLVKSYHMHRICRVRGNKCNLSFPKPCIWYQRDSIS